MDEMTHRQLTYSQYIAPLMANFETKTTNNTVSTIKYFTNSAFKCNIIIVVVVVMILLLSL